MSKQTQPVSRVLWDDSPVSAIPSSPSSPPNPGLTIRSSSPHPHSSSRPMTPMRTAGFGMPRKRPIGPDIPSSRKKQMIDRLVTPLSKSRNLLHKVSQSSKSSLQHAAPVARSISQVWHTTRQKLGMTGATSSSPPSSPMSKDDASPPSSPAQSSLRHSASPPPEMSDDSLGNLDAASNDIDEFSRASEAEVETEDTGSQFNSIYHGRSSCSEMGFDGDQSDLGDTDEEIDVVGCSDEESAEDTNNPPDVSIKTIPPMASRQVHASRTYDSDVIVIESSSDDVEYVQDGGSSSDISPHSSLQVLYNCLDEWEQKSDWTELVENNPLHDVESHPLMAEHVMDYVTAYLTHCRHASQPRSSKRICLVPAASSGALVGMEDISDGLDAWRSRKGPAAVKQLLSLRELVWVDPGPPSLVILPFINHTQVHSYVAYGTVVKRPGTALHDLHLNLLDSLGQPSKREIESRLAMYISILRFLVPQINGRITGSYVSIPRFRQAPGSTDCGWFVCQAVSAVAHGQASSLDRPLPIHVVKQRVQEILVKCRDGDLHQACMGHALPEVTLLHARLQPPPWTLKPDVLDQPRKPEAKPWIAPKMERSLSVPISDSRADDIRQGSWEDVFGARPEIAFEEVSVEAFKGYLDAISNGTYTPPPGLLADVGAQLPQSLLKALLLEGESDAMPWAPDARSEDESDDGGLEDPNGGVGLPTFLRGLRSIPEGRERSRAILTGERLNESMSLNWMKDRVELQEEWLTAGLDIDSLSLTADNPQFTSSVVFYTYPPRSSTLTTDNGLSVNYGGKSLKLSHIPNFTFAHTGSHNQFRINIFFPAYEKGLNAGKRYITMMNDPDYALWCNSVLLPALHRVELLCPPEYRHTATSLRQSVPKSYEDSKPRGGITGDSFKGFRMLPELFNLLLHYCRKIVDRFPQLAKFRGFFIHVYGQNLKAIGPETGRATGNALLHVFKQFPIVDWSLQNPRDIAVDVGLEINVLEEQLPNSIDELTLIWRLSALQKLSSHGWRKAHVNSYVHSHVIGGISVSPRTLICLMFYYMHAYMKDKVVTYEHRDYSHGATFSPLDGLAGSERYSKDINSLRGRLRLWTGCFGIRIEWRCGVWAANEILQMDPRIWIRRFLHCDAIIAVRTKHVVQLKVAFLDSYCWFFSQLQQLRAVERGSEHVLLLASVLTYLIQGLVKRPDEMSSSRFMAKSLNIVTRAQQFGFASVPLRSLSGDLLGMSHTLTYDSYKILDYTARKNPAGARLKSSRLLAVHNTTEADGSYREDVQSLMPAALEVDTEELGLWVTQLINNTLASWLWGRMGGGDKSQRAPPGAFQGPLLLQDWNVCVDVNVRYEIRSSTTGYSKVVNSLFPLNWVKTDSSKVWDTMQTMVLDPIRERLAGMSPQARSHYSQRIRGEISRVMRTWEYLPCVQKGRVWSYEGPGKTKRYMLYSNPAFTTRRR
ncbi:capsular polysaccharide export protein [Ceratobasidium sp. AG-Ba]|nr:capsular polysaccharide export protein [Ceratobasidium sp. AG-Ba]